jgi:hypothetical protein
MKQHHAWKSYKHAVRRARKDAAFARSYSPCQMIRGGRNGRQRTQPEAVFDRDGNFLKEIPRRPEAWVRSEKSS